ncbi:hypothetical protein [Gemmata sp. SH-PL17]|uniref:hypothetical protein n=1 Tax=Gemmata sp. SH-PL17 TaxID=1630693 RepID=UPI0009EF24C9|nr:hypothetical protein [Gemmata sp. SH-PL17]
MDEDDDIDGEVALVLARGMVRAELTQPKREVLRRLRTHMDRGCPAWRARLLDPERVTKVEVEIYGRNEQRVELVLCALSE